MTTLFRTSSGTIAAGIADADGGIARGIRKLSSGTTTVTAANTFTGATRVEAGTLALGSGGSFAAASSLEMFAGATLDLAGQSQTFASVSGTAGTIALGAGTLTVNAAASNSYGGGITGTGGLTKQGVGNVVLSGSNTYSGATSVAAGRLSVNGSLGNSAVAVLAAAELGGSGSIAGPVSIAAGGTLAPGNSIASLAAGATSFASGATFAYEVDSSAALAAAADLLVVNGDLNLDPGNASLLTLADLASSVSPFVEDTTIFALINYSGSWNGGLFTYGSNVLADGERFMVGSQQWEIDYDRTSSVGLANFTGDYLPNSSFVAITAVPEPSTLMLMAIGAGLAAVAGFRRRAFVR